MATAPKVRYEDEAYSASASALLDLITSVGDKSTTVLLIGHNPALSQLSTLLDPERSDPEGLRTAGAAVHTWDGSWVECGPRAAPLTTVHTARA